MGAPASALWFLVYGAFRVPLFPSLTTEQQAQRGLVAAGCHTAAEWQKPKVISAQSVWGRVSAAKSENAGLGPGFLRLDQEPELPRCLVPRPCGRGSAASPAVCAEAPASGGARCPHSANPPRPAQGPGARSAPAGPCSAGSSVAWGGAGSWRRLVVSRGRDGGGGRGREVTEGHGGPAPTPNSILAIRCDLHNDPSRYSEEAKAQRGWPCS